MLKIRTALLSSIRYLPYDQYKEVLIAAVDNQDDRYKTTNNKLSRNDIKLNYDLFINVLDHIDFILTEKLNNRNDSEIKDIFVLDKVDASKQFSTKSWLDIFKTNLETIIQDDKIPVEQALKFNVLSAVSYDTTLISSSIKEVLASQVSLISRQLSSNSLKNYIYDKVYRDQKPRTEKLLLHVLGEIKDSLINPGDIQDFINEITQDFRTIVKVGKNEERDTENVSRRYESIDKSGTDLEIDLDKVDPKIADQLQEVQTCIEGLHKFNTQEINYDAFGDAYKSAMLLMNSLKEVKITTPADVIKVFNKFKEESITSKTFERFAKEIDKYLNSKTPTEGNYPKQKITFPGNLKDVNTARAMDILARKYNDTKIDMDREETMTCAAFIASSDFLIRIYNILENIVQNIEPGIENKETESPKEEKEVLSMYQYGRFFEVENTDGRFSIKEKNDSKIDSDIDYLTKNFTDYLNKAPYLFVQERLSDIRTEFSGITGNFEVGENGAIVERDSVQLFRDLGMDAKKQETLTNALLDQINMTETGKKFTSFISKLYNKNKYVKRALGLSGKFIFNFGKMALYFINHGGYDSFYKGLDYLRKMPGNYLKGQLIQPEEAKQVYTKIYRDSGLRKAYATLLSFQQSNPKVPLFDNILIKGKKADNKRKALSITVSYFSQYRNLIRDNTVLQKLRTITEKSINLSIGLKKESIEEVLNFLDKVYSTQFNSIEELQTFYDESKKQFYNPNVLKDVPTAMWNKLTLMYSMGTAGTASSYDGRDFNNR